METKSPCCGAPASRQQMTLCKRSGLWLTMFAAGEHGDVANVNAAACGGVSFLFPKNPAARSPALTSFCSPSIKGRTPPPSTPVLAQLAGTTLSSLPVPSRIVSRIKSPPPKKKQKNFPPPPGGGGGGAATHQSRKRLVEFSLEQAFPCSTHLITPMTKRDVTSFRCKSRDHQIARFQLRETAHPDRARSRRGAIGIRRPNST